MGGPFHHPLLHLGGQGGAGQLNSLHAQGDDLGAFGELGQKGLPSLGQRPSTWGGVGCWQPDLRQLCDSELAEGPPDAFDIPAQAAENASLSACPRRAVGC